MKVRVKLRELNEAMAVKVVEAGVVRSAARTLMKNARAVRKTHDYQNVFKHISIAIT